MSFVAKDSTSFQMELLKACLGGVWGFTYLLSFGTWKTRVLIQKIHLSRFLVRFAAGRLFAGGTTFASLAAPCDQNGPICREFVARMFPSYPGDF